MPDNLYHPVTKVYSLSVVLFSFSNLYAWFPLRYWKQSAKFFIRITLSNESSLEYFKMLKNGANVKAIIRKTNKLPVCHVV